MELYENNFDLDDTISEAKILEFINELYLSSQLLEETPAEIDTMKDTIERNHLLNNFNTLNEIYVLPLSEMANRVSNRLTGQRKIFVGIDDFSIKKRMTVIRKYLISKGVSEDTILKLIPKTVEEVNLLAEARKSGFSLEFGDADSLSNEDRLMRARKHLEQLSENTNHRLK